MRENLRLLLFLTNFIVSHYALTSTPLNLTPNVQYEDYLISLALKVCNDTHDQSLLHVVDLNEDPAVTPLIEVLHDSLIPTILINHHTKLTDTLATHQKKKIMFFVNDPEEALSLILTSVSSKNQFGNTDNSSDARQLRVFADTDFSNNQISPRIHTSQKLPHYCVQIDDQLKPGSDAVCDEKMALTYQELESTSLLSDQNFELTRGLYANPIWNSNNLLIFMLKKCNRNNSASTPSVNQFYRTGGPQRILRDTNEVLILIFKFFWRFFRGYKTIICFERDCARYDIFAEKIMWYDADNSGPFFDFSVNNMHGKLMHLVLDHLTTDEGIFCLSFDLSWYDVLVDIVTHPKNLINCTIEHHYATILGMTEYNDHENGQKIGADFHISRSMFRHGIAGVSRFDHSISVESRVAFIITPRSSFIPQVLVGFKSFTLVVWIFLLITTFIFFLMQYCFQCSQSRILYRFYTEAQILQYESTSSLLTVYSYFICGSPPTLLLGKFFTGKILFLILSFSALIFSTVFLGAMTTLLTNRVRYSEINSLQDLAASDLLIQTEHTLAAREVFTQYGESKELTAKLTSNLAYYEQTVNMYIAYDSSFKEELLKLSRNEDEGSVRAKDIYKNVKAIIEMDAILIEVPSSFIKRNSIKLEIWGPLKSEYHVVAESVVQNPFSFSLYKNMFLNDIFKKKVVQYMESGLVKKIIEQSMAEVPLEMDIIPPQTEEEPRPYNLNDLQPAFITLPLGFLVSFLVFIGEMMTEHFPNFRLLKCLAWLENSF